MTICPLVYTTRRGRTERLALIESDQPAEAVFAGFAALQAELKAAGRLDYCRPVRVASPDELPATT